MLPIKLLDVPAMSSSLKGKLAGLGRAFKWPEEETVLRRPWHVQGHSLETMGCPGACLGPSRAQRLMQGQILG
jgi:hypothetical protein